MDGILASCAGLTRASMMRRKSKILATDHLRCLIWMCRVKPGNDGQDAGAAIHMDGRYSASCAGLTRASMMRRKSKILATDHLRCLMDCRVKPGNDAGAAIHMDGRYSASCAGLTRAFMMRRKSNILATDHLRCLMDCRVKPGNDGQDAGAAIHMDGRYSASCAGLTRASMIAHPHSAERLVMPRSHGE